jgi:hypothetical protein
VRPYLKNNQNIKVWDADKVTELLLNKHKALNSISQYKKEKKKKNFVYITATAFWGHVALGFGPTPRSRAKFFFLLFVYSNKVKKNF